MLNTGEEVYQVLEKKVMESPSAGNKSNGILFILYDQVMEYL